MSQERHQQSLDAAAQRRYGVSFEDIKETLGFELVHDSYWQMRADRQERLRGSIEQLERRPPQDAEETLSAPPEGKETSPMVNAREIAAQRLRRAAPMFTDRHTRQAFEEAAVALDVAKDPERVRWAHGVAKALGC